MWGFRLSEEQKKYVKEKLNIDTDTDGIWSWSYNYNEDKTLNKEKPYRLTENGMVKATYGDSVYWDIFEIDPENCFSKYCPSGYWHYWFQVDFLKEHKALFESYVDMNRAIAIFKKYREMYRNNPDVRVTLTQE